MHTVVTGAVVVVVVVVVQGSEDVGGECLPCSVAFSQALPLSVLGPTTVHVPLYICISYSLQSRPCLQSLQIL